MERAEGAHDGVHGRVRRDALLLHLGVPHLSPARHPRHHRVQHAPVRAVSRTGQRRWRGDNHQGTLGRGGHHESVARAHLDPHRLLRRRRRGDRGVHRAHAHLRSLRRAVAARLQPRQVRQRAHAAGRGRDGPGVNEARVVCCCRVNGSHIAYTVHIEYAPNVFF